MDSKARYVLSLFRRVYGVDQSVEIGYGKESAARVRIQRSSTDYFDGRTPLDTRKIVWRTWQGRPIPFLFDDTEQDVIAWSESGAVIQYDIVASAFYFLSGWQEYVETDSDEFGRFPYRKSIQYQLGISEVPVVNYYLDILRVAIEGVYGRDLKVTLWPDAPFVTFLSHDIDKVSSGWMEESFHALKRARVFAPVGLTWRRLAGRDVWFNIEDILEIETAFGAPSTFFFLCRKDRANADYDIRESRFSSLMAHLETSGAEVGLHGSIGTHVSHERLSSDLDRLGRRAVGNRFHFLNFDMVRTPSVLENSGMRYDASLGFPEQRGFRNGCCYPFYLYNIERNRPTKVVEIPLVLMDASIRSYMGQSPSDVPEIVDGLVGEVKKFQGCLSVLWHNNYFSPHKYRGWEKAYRSVLDTARRENALFLTGGAIADRFDGPPRRTP